MTDESTLDFLQAEAPAALARPGHEGPCMSAAEVGLCNLPTRLARCSPHASQTLATVLPQRRDCPQPPLSTL